MSAVRAVGAALPLLDPSVLSHTGTLSPPPPHTTPLRPLRGAQAPLTLLVALDVFLSFNAFCSSRAARRATNGSIGAEDSCYFRSRGAVIPHPFACRPTYLDERFWG